MQNKKLGLQRYLGALSQKGPLHASQRPALAGQDRTKGGHQFVNGMRQYVPSLFSACYNRPPESLVQLRADRYACGLDLWTGEPLPKNGVDAEDSE